LQSAVAVLVLDTGRQRIDEIVAEEHIDIDKLRIAANLRRDFLKQLRSDDLTPALKWLRHRPRAQDLLADVVILPQLRLVAALRPARGEHRVGRFEKDVGIDQRASAEACAQYDVDFVVIADVEQPALLDIGDDLRAAALLEPLVPEIARHAVRGARKRAELVTLAALEHEHASRPFLAQPAGVDRAAEAGADNDRLVGFGHDAPKSAELRRCGRGSFSIRGSMTG